MTELLRLRDGELDWREVEEQVVALDLRTQQYLAVNRAGRALWQELVSGATQDELVDRLIASFGIDQSIAERDVAAFIADLDAQGLLVREGAAPEPPSTD
jgi:hypothetical protein